MRLHWTPALPALRYPQTQKAWHPAQLLKTQPGYDKVQLTRFGGYTDEQLAKLEALTMPETGAASKARQKQAEQLAQHKANGRQIHALLASVEKNLQQAEQCEAQVIQAMFDLIPNPQKPERPLPHLRSKLEFFRQYQREGEQSLTRAIAEMLHFKQALASGEPEKKDLNPNTIPGRIQAHLQKTQAYKPLPEWAERQLKGYQNPDGAGELGLLLGQWRKTRDDASSQLYEAQGLAPRVPVYKQRLTTADKAANMVYELFRIGAAGFQNRLNESALGAVYSTLQGMTMVDVALIKNKEMLERLWESAPPLESRFQIPYGVFYQLIDHLAEDVSQSLQCYQDSKG